MWCMPVKCLHMREGSAILCRLAYNESAKCWQSFFSLYWKEGSRDGTVVRALASHQCGPVSIPRLGVICGLSLLLVLYSAPTGFSPGSPVFPSPQKPTLPNSNSIWNPRATGLSVVRLLSVTLIKQSLFIYLFIYPRHAPLSH